MERFRDFTKNIIKDIILPVKQQKEDKGPPDPRAAEVYLMRLPDSRAADKKAPYILHQVLTSKDTQPTGARQKSSTAVRSVFCVYNDDEQEGALALMNLMERMRIALLKKGVVGDQFRLDLTVGLETLIYTEDTRPYYISEMITTWDMPSVTPEA